MLARRCQTPCGWSRDRGSSFERLERMQRAPRRSRRVCRASSRALRRASARGRGVLHVKRSKRSSGRSGGTRRRNISTQRSPSASRQLRLRHAARSQAIGFRRARQRSVVGLHRHRHAFSAARRGVAKSARHRALQRLIDASGSQPRRGARVRRRFRASPGAPRGWQRTNLLSTRANDAPRACRGRRRIPQGPREANHALRSSHSESSTNGNTCRYPGGNGCHGT